MKRFAIGLFLAAAATMAYGDVVVGPEQPASAATADAAPADFVESAQAISGDGAILVWAAQHRDLWQVVARRVDSGGNLLDDPPLPLTALGPFTQPAVDWNGTRYVAAWAHDHVIEARTIDRDGTLGAVSIVGNVTKVVRTIVRCGAGRCVVAWSESDDSYKNFRVSAAIVGNDALLIAPPAVLYDAVVANELTAAAGGGHFLVAINNNLYTEAPGQPSAADELSGTIVDPSGAVTARFTIPASGKTTADINAVYDSGRFVIAYNAANAKLAHVSTDGNLLATYDVTATEMFDFTPWNGQFIATSYGYDTKHVWRGAIVRLDGYGTIWRTTAPLAACGYGPFLPLTAETALMVTSCGRTLRTQRLDAGTLALSPPAIGTPVAIAPADQDAPMIASAGAHDAMVVWSESQTDQYYDRAAVAMRLRDGVPQGDPVVLTRQLVHYPNVELSIAAGTSTYLAVWAGDAVEGLLFTPTGTVPLAFPASQLSVSAAWDGTAYVVAYATGENIAYHSVVHPELARIDEAGNMLATGLPAGIDGRSVRLRCGDGACIVMTEYGAALVTNGTPSRLTNAAIADAAPVADGFILAARTAAGVQWWSVNANGALSAPHASLPSAEDGGISATPFGSGAMIAWTTPARDVVAIVVDAAGNVVEGPFPLAADGDEESLPSLTASRAAYVRATNLPGLPRLQRAMTRAIAIPKRRSVAH